MNYSLLQQGFALLIIEKETKERYVEFFDSQDLDSFFRFAKQLLEKEQKRYSAVSID